MNPILEISPEDLGAQRSRLVLSRIENVMLWPHDPSMRAQAHHTALMLETLRHLENGDEREREAIKASIDVAQMVRDALEALPPAVMQQHAREAISDGLRAGLILDNLLVLGKADEKLRSLKVHKAKVAGIDMSDLGGEKAVSVSTINTKIWPRYQPVAHLWFAYLMTTDDGTFPCKLPDLEAFLATAEAIRKMGETFKIHQSDSFALDRDETWRLPDGLPLPTFQIKIDRRVSH